MKRIGLYLLGVIAVCCFLSSCASIYPVTDRIIEEVGGEDRLSDFQYYISRDIVLSRQQKETDANITKGQAKVVETTKKNKINILKSTPGVVINHRYRSDKNTYVLCVAFEDGDENYLQFAHLGNPNPESRYTLVTTSSDKSKIIYGSDEYIYSFPDKLKSLKKNKFLGKIIKNQDYGEVPCLLIKRNKKSIVKTDKRTVKGRRIE